jgi:hypothetical protein
VDSSAATHVAPAQNFVLASHICFLPGVGHDHDEHLILFVVQQRAFPWRPAIDPSLLESLNFPVPQATVDFLHLVGSSSQHVARSAVSQAPFAQRFVKASATFLSPAAHVANEHEALNEQQATLGSAGVTLFFAVSLNRLLPQVTAVLAHWLLSVTQ